MKVILGVFLFAFLAHAENPKYIVEDQQSKYQVEVDDESHKIKVINLGNAVHKPKNMSITLYRNLETEQTINLEAVDVSAQRPEYQGNLGPGQGSFVGFQLKFNLPKDGLRVLKYMPKIPGRQQR